MYGTDDYSICSMCRSEAFKFARLVSCCDIPYNVHVNIEVRFGSCFIYVICIYCCILVPNAISSGAGYANHSGAPLLLSGIHVVRSLAFWIMFYGSLFVLLWFFVWPLFCMSFCYLHLLITTLISSNSSHLNMWYSPFKKINNVST
jgi:hypothetical protein